MKTSRHWMGWILLWLLPLPFCVLMVSMFRANHLPTPRVLVSPGGDSLLALAPFPPMTDGGAPTQVLRGDGSIAWVDGWAHSVLARDVWLLWQKDSPPRMGRLLGVVVAPGDTLRGDRAISALREMPGPLGADGADLERELQAAENPRDRIAARDRLQRFVAQQEGIVVRIHTPGTGQVSVPLIGIRHAETFEGGWIREAVRMAERIRFRLEAPADAGSGGGLWSAIWATGLVVLLAGILGGLPALFLAVSLADQIDQAPGVRWLRWASEGFSGVPGVVWGGLCAAILAYLGPLSAAGSGEPVPVGKGIFLAGLALGVLSAPITFSRAMEAIDRVPRSSREIARSCGATRHQVLFWVVLPACRRGLLGAWLSGLARACGESAPLLLVGASAAIGVRGSGFAEPSSLVGEFQHLGALAYTQPWPPVQAIQGNPLAYLALTLLATGCVALEWASMRAQGGHA